MKYLLVIILITLTISGYSQGQYGCNCRNEILYFIEEIPQQPSERINFKELLATEIDTNNFIGSDTGSFVTKFYINKCGDVKSLKILNKKSKHSKAISAALPNLGKWRPGNNSGKICCVYVALKFEFAGSSWHIKRLNPYTLEEDPTLYFEE